MHSTYNIKLLMVPCAILGMSIVSTPALAYCQDYWTAAYKCSQGCGSCGGGNISPPVNNYEEERRAQEAAAERQRQQDETDRIERERLAEEKRIEEKRKNDEFIHNRDATAKTLKGNIGVSTSPNDGGLKGSSKIDTGLKELHGSDRVTRDIQGRQAAWKQLHCAAALSGYAFAAVSKKTPDYQESSFLLDQALNALNGQTLGVACPSAPAFPTSPGHAINMEQVKQTQKIIISRALVITQRMQQRAEPPAASPVSAKATTETSDEKARRVQRDLNQANNQKITGKAQAEINQQERDRQELAQLILANSDIEKGKLTSVSVSTGDEATPKARRKSVPAPQ